MLKPTLGEILKPTKGDESYMKIAQRANNWFRMQSEKGRSLDITRMSGEQVRRIFEDSTAQPKAIYLEALAAAQNIDVNLLYEAAGHPIPANSFTPVNLTDLADQTVSKLRMFAGSKRPTKEEITKAEKKIIAEFNRLKSEQ